MSLYLKEADGGFYHEYYDRRVFVRLEKDEMHTAFFIKDLIAGSPCSLLSDDSIEFSRNFGFIYPPFTIYRGIYLVPAGTIFYLRDGRIVLGNLIDSLKLKVGSGIRPEDVSCLLLDKLSGFVLKELSSKNYCFFSAGIDSSVLLSLAHRADPKVTALMCDMPSMPKESAKAAEMCTYAGISLSTVHLNEQMSSEVHEATNLLYEPIYDEAAILLLGLCQQTAADLSKGIVFDGQGADSLLVGLPHNRVLSLYHKTYFIRPIFSIFRILPILKNKNTPLNRFLYRARRALGLLGADNHKKFIMESLLLPSGEIKNISPEYMAAIFEDIERLKNYYNSDWQAVMRAVFLLRVLPAREMQKYDVLRKAGYQVRMPFMDRELIECFMSIQPRLFVMGQLYKFPIFSLCQKLWPGFFEKFSTSPFYFKFSVAEGEQGLFVYSLNILKSK